MPILSLIALATILQTQSAPVDVPKDHWAFPAVDTLFREGLLKGYPPEKRSALKLDRSVKLDESQVLKWKDQWQAHGLLIGYSTGLHQPAEPSRYYMAVFTYVAWENLIKGVGAEEIALEVPGQIAQGISMLNGELTLLGANPLAMIQKLNDAQHQARRLFHGDRL